ncbi:hypothetical protein ETH_00010090, partial [Eimeria tenella]
SRTIARLRGKLEEANNEINALRNQAGALSTERQKAQQQAEMFRHNIKGMGDLQRNLTEELAEASRDQQQQQQQQQQLWQQKQQQQQH